MIISRGLFRLERELSAVVFFENKMNDKQHEKIFPMIVRIFLHGTWGIIQSTAGFFLFLRYIKYPHSFYRGVIRTAWPMDGGISLGMFIFTPPLPEKEPAKHRTLGNGDPTTESRQKYCEEVAVHEFGHTFQSLILGPFYLLIVGLPSIVWANFPAIRKMRSKKKMPYTWLFCEKWASLWGEKITKHKAIR